MNLSKLGNENQEEVTEIQSKRRTRITIRHLQAGNHKWGGGTDVSADI